MPNTLQVGDSAAWKERFRAPIVQYTLLARSAPDRGMALSNRPGVYQLHAWDVTSGDLRQLTHQPTGKLFGVVSPDGRYVYYLHDEKGNEIGHFVRVPFEGGEPEDITPDMPPYASWSLDVSRASNMASFIAADQEGFHVHYIELGEDGVLGTPRRIFTSERMTLGPWLSHGGEIALIQSTERGLMLQYNLVAVETSTGERISDLWDGPGTSVDAVMFSPQAGDFRVLATTNRSGAKRPLIWDPKTGERTDLDLGDLEGEVLPFDWSDDAKLILLSHFNKAVQQLYVYNVDGSTFTRLDHAGGTYGFFAAIGCYFTTEGEIFAQWQDSTHPPQVIALDARTGRKTRQVLAAGEVPPGHGWRSVSFRSSDGQEIQGWLGLPDGEGPYPTILHTHGGPEAVTTELFAPGSQSWLDHGFAFLTINYRGSTTFGKAFQEKIRGNPGEWEVEDVAAACDWLVGEGIANPDQILLTGGSYGGYLTLLPLGKRPDLWAGGMGLVAIADWASMYEDSAETLRGYMVGMFGGTPQEKPDQYAKSSPITYAENVQAPLLVIQGRNDTRCPDRQMEEYEARMRDLGKEIQVHWFDAGHGALDVAQQIEHQEMMLRFAYRVLGFDEA